MSTFDRDDSETPRGEPASAFTDRPEPGSGVPERIRAWVEWFGVLRLVTSAVAMIVVCLGAFWLIRTPPPSIEAALPMTSEVPTVDPSGVSTLPPPVTVAASSDSASDDAEANADADAVRVVVVHVAGSVERPGVYELGGGSRVDDAVAFAGGPTEDADVDALNLASVLSDGARIYVPEIGEEVDASTLVSGGASPIVVGAVDDEPKGPVDLNAASSVELETLPGIGPATAFAIITEREANGPFAGVADLERVPGIGPIKLAALTGLVTT